MGAWWAYRKNFHFCTHFLREIGLFKTQDGPMHKNISFVPMFCNKSRGTGGKFFCIDPQEAEKTEKFSFYAADMGIKHHFFCIGPQEAERDGKFPIYMIFQVSCSRNAFLKREMVEKRIRHKGKGASQGGAPF